MRLSSATLRRLTAASNAIILLCASLEPTFFSASICCLALRVVASKLDKPLSLSPWLIAEEGVREVPLGDLEDAVLSKGLFNLLNLRSISSNPLLTAVISNPSLRV